MNDHDLEAAISRLEANVHAISEHFRGRIDFADVEPLSIDELRGACEEACDLLGDPPMRDDILDFVSTVESLEAEIASNTETANLTRVSESIDFIGRFFNHVRNSAADLVDRQVTSGRRAASAASSVLANPAAASASLDSSNDPLLRRLLALVFPKRIMARVFDQIVLDMVEEASEAREAGEVWRARWIITRGWIEAALAIAKYVATGHHWVLRLLLGSDG